MIEREQPYAKPYANDKRALGALALALLFWALAFPATRIALQAYPPDHLALARYILATLVLLAYCVFVRAPLPRRADLLPLALTGLLCGTAYQLGFNFGMRSVASGPAAVLVDTVPIFASLFGFVFLRERPSVRAMAGIVLGFIGVVLISRGEAGAAGYAFEPDAGYLLLAALAFSLGAVVQKPLLSRLPAIPVTAYYFVAATLGLAGFAPGLPASIAAAPASANWALLFLALFPAATSFALWSYALARLPVAKVSSSLYLVPVLTFPIAWVWFDEAPSALSFVGGALALAGVLLVQLKAR
ncbi:MAG: DMT family transporter [Burkholderiales bacterium]|nr:DMT family transporter [Burkholderiales bacterium]